MVFNKVYICKELTQVTTVVLESIAGIILPAISFTSKKIEGSIL